MISIIITSYKEPATLGKAIEQILKNPIKDKFEVIISAPDKETLNVARAFAKKDKRIKVFQDKGKGKPAALNLLFKKAKGEILVLTDGDVFMSDDAINPLLKKLKDSRIGAVTGRPMPQEFRQTKYGYWAHFLFNAAHENRIQSQKNNKFMLLSGYLFAMKNFHFQIPEDILDDAFISQLIFKKGYKIAYEPSSKVYIKNPSNFKDWIRQKKRNIGGDKKISFYLGNIQKSRSFKEEIAQSYKILSFSKSTKELWFSLELVFARLIAWIMGFYDTVIKKRSMKEIWVRIESTK